MSMGSNLTSSGISVVIPAYNEEKFLPETVASINKALRKLKDSYGIPSEIIVVDNASTDNTPKVATELGAKVLKHEVRNIASVRNAGIRAATYDLVATVDSDTIVPEHAFVEIWAVMQSREHIGGGVRLGILTNKIYLKILLFVLDYLVSKFAKLSAGMFFFWKTEGLEIGGFPESHYAAEDMAFAKALKAQGLKKGKPFLNLRTVKIMTLDRKDVTAGEILNAFYVGAKASFGAKLTKRDLEYWYNPKR